MAAKAAVSISRLGLEASWNEFIRTETNSITGQESQAYLVTGIKHSEAVFHSLCI